VRFLLAEQNRMYGFGKRLKTRTAERRQVILKWKFGGILQVGDEGLEPPTFCL